MYANLSFKKEKTFLSQAGLANMGFSFLVARVDRVLQQRRRSGKQGNLEEKQMQRLI